MKCRFSFIVIVSCLVKLPNATCDPMLERRLQILEQRVDCLEEPVWQIGAPVEAIWERCGSREGQGGNGCSCDFIYKKVQCSLKDKNEKFIWSNQILGTDVESLDLSGISIGILPANLFRGLKRLKELNLNNAKIKHLSKYIFYPLENLLHLDLSGNELGEVTGEQLKNLKELRSINLSDNRLETLSTDFFGDNPKLDVVTLSMNKLSIVYPQLLDGLTELRIVDFSWNNIWSAELSSPSADNIPSSCSLESVDLGRNVLETFTLGESLSNCSALTELDLSFNELTKLPDNMPDTLVALKQLKMSKNGLKTFDPSLLPRGLHSLDLSRNMIETLIPFTPTEESFSILELEVLNLGSNMLTSLLPGYFEAFPKLQFLKLEDNMLETVSVKNLPKSLAGLYLRSNQLPRLIDFDELSSLPNLSTLDITHNLWHCDCGFLPFLDWIQAHPTLVNGHVLKCNTPPEMETQTVLDVLEMDC